MQKNDNSKHGFWNDKNPRLKSLVWKLDRDVWALVQSGKATTSWGRQESAKLIIDYLKEPSDTTRFTEGVKWICRKLVFKK